MNKKNDLDKLAEAGKQKLNESKHREIERENQKIEKWKKRFALTTHPLYGWKPHTIIKMVFILGMVLAVGLLLSEIFNVPLYPGKGSETPFYKPETDDWGLAYSGIMFSILFIDLILFFIIHPTRAKKSVEKEFEWLDSLPFEINKDTYANIIGSNSHNKMEFDISFKSSKASLTIDYLRGIIKSSGKKGSWVEGIGEKKAFRFGVGVAHYSSAKDGYYIRKEFHQFVNDVLLPLHENFSISKFELK